MGPHCTYGGDARVIFLCTPKSGGFDEFLEQEGGLKSPQRGKGSQRSIVFGFVPSSKEEHTVVMGAQYIHALNCVTPQESPRM